MALVSDLDNTDDQRDRVLLMTLHSAKGLEFPHVYITGMEDGIFPSSMALNSRDDEAEEEERRLAYVGITRAKDDLTLTCSLSRMLRGEVQYNPMSRFLTEIPEELFEGESPVDPFSGFSSGQDDFGYGRRERSNSRYDFSDMPFGDPPAAPAFESRHAASAFESKPARPRPKAVYRKPSTDDSKKPYIAKASGVGRSLGSLSKGMPSAPSKPDYQVGDRVMHTKYGEGIVKALEAGPRDYKVTVVFDEFGQKIMYAAFAKLVKC